MNIITKSVLALLVILISVSPAYAQSFTKITQGEFVNHSAASRSVNFVDYDGDGSVDLFVSNGKRYGQRNFLYKNINGVFTRILGTAVVNDSLPFDGASWADYDNDGKPDLCVVTWYDSTTMLYHNEGNGVFTLMSSSRIVTDRGFSETCSWGDYDDDGLVDLIITNSAGSNHRNFLYRNTGSGNFVRIDTGIVVSEVNHDCRGVNWVDIDGDGRTDLFICCENGQNNLCYKNNGNGYYTKITSGSLVNDVGNSWSASWADYDNDGDLDVFVTNTAHLNNFLYRNDGNFSFTKITNDTLVNEPGYYACATWGDFDNDGDLDIFVTQAYGPVGVPLKNVMYKNLLMETGIAKFEKVTTGDIVNDAGYSYGTAAADWNKDGFLDIYVAKTFGENENNAAYQNNGNSNKWIEFNCTGIISNKSAIGTKVRVKAVINGNPVWQMRVVDGQSGYCGQSLGLHFGLGNATIIDSVKVEWPSGSVNTYTSVAADQIANLIENQGLFGLEQHGSLVPKEYNMMQNYPNPFNPVTKIRFTIPKNDFVNLTLFDITGRLVKSLLSNQLAAGSYDYSFDAAGLSSGVYFYRIETQWFSDTKKMVLLK